MGSYRSEYFSGAKAKLPLMKFRLSFLRYFFQRDRYPLFYINSSRGGLLSTNKMQKKLKICKFTRFNNYYYFSLTVPHWPSKAFDRMVAGGGLNITAAGTPLKKQIDTVIMGITRLCPYKCSHCYEYYNLAGDDTVPIEIWKKTVSELQKAGVNIITFSGGEPMMRYQGLIELLKTADHSLSDFHLHTSGYGVTEERAAGLKMEGLHAAGIGLDDVDPVRNDLFRGYKGAFDQAVNAIKCFREAGVLTYINFCPSKEIIQSGNIYRYLEMLKDLNVGFVRWLEPRPCGRYSDELPEDLISNEDCRILREIYFNMNAGPEYMDYPPVSYEALTESPGNMGCMMAGNSLLYIDSLGNVEPCVFLPVTFGNIVNEDISVILERMKRIIPRPLHTTCPSVLMSRKIKFKRANGATLPINYEELTDEFSELEKSQMTISI